MKAWWRQRKRRRGKKSIDFFCYIDAREVLCLMNWKSSFFLFSWRGILNSSLFVPSLVLLFSLQSRLWGAYLLTCAWKRGRRFWGEKRELDNRPFFVSMSIQEKTIAGWFFASKTLSSSFSQGQKKEINYLSLKNFFEKMCFCCELINHHSHVNFSPDLFCSLRVNFQF